MSLIPSRIGLASLQLAIALSCVSLAAHAAPQNSKGLGDDIKRADRDIAAARDKLQSAKKQADEAKAHLRKAAAALEKATDHAGDVRRKVEQEHDSAPPLVAARKLMEAHQAEFEDASRPVLEKLRQQAEYAAAVEQRDGLKAKASGTPSSERESLAKQYAAALAAVRSLEATALQTDPKAKSAKEKLAAAGSKVQALVTQRNEAVDRDSRLVDARRELDKAKGEAAKAKQKAEAESKQFADAERKVKHEEQQKHNLQQKQKQQQNNNNKKKKK